jgi:hypothetical protein
MGQWLHLLLLKQEIWDIPGSSSGFTGSPEYVPVMRMIIWDCLCLKETLVVYSRSYLSLIRVPLLYITF